MEGGVAQTPFIESTPAYVGDRKFASLALDERIRDFLTSLASKESGELLFNPPYEHQAQALEATIYANAGGTGIVVTTGTGSGKTESFLLPVLARLAEEAIHRPKHFSERAVRALLLYPMNALVNDQLGRLRTLFGSSAVRGWFTSRPRAPGQIRPLYWPDALSGHSRWRARSKAAEDARILSEDRGWRARRQRKGQGARSNSPKEGAAGRPSLTASLEPSTVCATGMASRASIGRIRMAIRCAQLSEWKTQNCSLGTRFREQAQICSSQTIRCSNTCCCGQSSDRFSRIRAIFSKRTRTRNSS